MCRLQNIGMRDYQESETDAGQSDPYVLLRLICFAGDTKSSSFSILHVHVFPV